MSTYSPASPIARDAPGPHRGFRARLHADDAAAGIWLNLADPLVAGTIARAGYDWACVDQQHGYADDDASGGLIAAARAAGGPALVRVAWNRPELIGRALDAGADGVIVPMVETADEAGAAVAAVRYAPAGRRSWGPRRTTTGLELPDAAFSNDSTACLVMVETPAALERVAEIAAVDGLDGVFLGPFDLALALGVPLDELLDDDSERSPLRRVVAACDAHGIVPAAYAGSLARAEALAGHGFRMIAVASDDGLLAEAGDAVLAEARELLASATGARR